MEHDPTQKSLQEESPKQDIQEGVDKVEVLSQKVEERASKFKNLVEAKSEHLPQNELAPTAEKVESRTKKFLKTAGAIALGLSVAGVLDQVRSHVMTRYEITESKDEDGTSVFKHEDAETTAIMDYLTGKASLPEKDKVYLYRELVRDESLEWEALNGHYLSLEEQEQLEETLPTNKEALLKLMATFHEKMDHVLGETVTSLPSHKSPEMQAEAEYEDVGKVGTFYSPEFASALWTLQKEVGAPKIRWSAPGMNTRAYLQGQFAGPGRAFYDSETNTIFITPRDTPETLMAEDSHAYQFAQKPITSRITYVLNMAETAVASIKNASPIYVEQYKQYSKPGSIENEAHSVIQPKIAKELGRLTKRSFEKETGRELTDPEPLL